MAKKKKEQPQELSEMSGEELLARLREVRENHFRLQFRHASSPLKNPMQIRQARREIARLMTALQSKTGSSK